MGEGSRMPGLKFDSTISLPLALANGWNMLINLGFSQKC